MEKSLYQSFIACSGRLVAVTFQTPLSHYTDQATSHFGGELIDNQAFNIKHYAFNL